MGKPALIAAVALVLASGCGGDRDGEPADDVQVIEEWVTTLARGDVKGAAELFAIPSVAENGGVVFRIDTAADAVVFNHSLPCGAELLRTTTRGELTVATFRLTERPGPGTCGAGTGEVARTAFAIEDGRIVEWRRVGIPPGGSEPIPGDTI